MIETWQCVIRVSVHMADIIADIKWKNFQCKGPSQSRRYFGLLALIYFTKIPLWMNSLKAEEGSFMIIATIVVKFKSIVRTLKYFKGWTFILQCRSFFSYCCIQSNWLCLKGRSHDFYKKYYLEIESNLFAYLQFPLGVVKVHQLWSQTINMCNKKTDWCANWSSCLKMFAWLSKNIPSLTKF